MTTVDRQVYVAAVKRLLHDIRQVEYGIVWHSIVKYSIAYYVRLHIVHVTILHYIDLWYPAGGARDEDHHRLSEDSR